MNCKLGVSIIVCCYNSEVRLPDTIRHLASQKNLNGIQWEVIIVDNNSKDNTVVIAEQEWEKYGLEIPLTIETEKRQGLAYARQKGVETSKYTFLIFCDDDNWLHADYLDRAYEILCKNESIGIVGGEGVACTETKKPQWFDKFQNVYAIGKQLPISGYANDRKYITGAGMVIRTEIFRKLDKAKFNSILSDRKGNSVSSGGDSEICLLAMQLGYDLYYDERLQFKHYIPTNRLNWSYCVEMVTRGFAYPQIYYAIYDYCFKAAINKHMAVFEDVYRWNIRKQTRILFNECKGLKKLLSAIAVLLYSKPGNDKEIRVKTAVNKLRYLRKNRRQLASDFETILQLSGKIEQLKKDMPLLHYKQTIEKK